MSIITIIILGIIQGVTEFLPVSSSGHVLIFSRLLNDPSSFELDVLISFGTLFAVIWYYRKRFIQILKDIVRQRNFDFALKLAVATIPAVVCGFLLQDIIEQYLHGPVTVTVMLLFIGIIMIISARWLPKPDLSVNKDLKKITYKQALWIGIAQCLALISGSSRSGVTMLAAIKMGFKSKVAAEWSFLMSVPIIAGASLKVLISEAGMSFIRNDTPAFIIANIISFIAGILSIHILLKILSNKGLYWFGWYRVVLAVFLLILLSAKII
ncbi:undecaprenyl-diphosphatase UppP [Candidatus Nomurabacteria bacterium]|jgi:undecaprenyl-diphosphatase|nr:undecaprenyl-diphosphatase UppP [Candidatus Saccharibacteria bacterium]MCA9313199.1 undecaprenyl-diphosphatase UppP [Candidatus Saccharibacteria bacterium]MCB9822201.1 undecaprenyl-diphosphatase UppP [Candidatus Nomurabacteria bacterium]